MNGNSSITTTKTTSPDLHPHTQALLDDLYTKRQRIIAMSDDLHRVDQVLAQVGDTIKHLKTYCYDFGCVQVNIKITHFNQMTEVLKAFADHGYHQSRPKDTNSSGWEWHLLHKDHHEVPFTGGIIDLAAEVPLETDASSPAPGCRRIKVGTQIYEEPIYKVVCSDEEVVQ